MIMDEYRCTCWDLCNRDETRGKKVGIARGKAEFTIADYNLSRLRDPEIDALFRYQVTITADSR